MSRQNRMTEAMIPVFHSVCGDSGRLWPIVAAIGNFDGVHLGHREILSRGGARMLAERGARAVAITFDPHPEQFLRPSQAPRLLTPMDERLRLLASTGIDAVVVLPFDAALATLAGAGVCAPHSGGSSGRA